MRACGIIIGASWRMAILEVDILKYEVLAMNWRMASSML